MTPEQNLQLLAQMQANRHFMLQAYQANPVLLACAEERIRLLFCSVGTTVKVGTAHAPSTTRPSAPDGVFEVIPPKTAHVDTAD